MREVFNNLVLEAIKYDSFDDFKTDIGWDDWMYDLLESQGLPVGEWDELTSQQIKIIDDFLMEAYQKAHRGK